MRFAIVASILISALSLNAQTLQGKVVSVDDGNAIMILEEATVQHIVRLNRIDAPEEGQSFGDVVMMLLQWRLSLCASGDGVLSYA